MSTKTTWADNQSSPAGTQLPFDCAWWVWTSVWHGAGPDVLLGYPIDLLRRAVIMTNPSQRTWRCVPRLSQDPINCWFIKEDSPSLTPWLAQGWVKWHVTAIRLSMKCPVSCCSCVEKPRSLLICVSIDWATVQGQICWFKPNMAALTAKELPTCLFLQSCESRAELRLIKWHEMFSSADVMEVWILLLQGCEEKFCSPEGNTTLLHFHFHLLQHQYSHHVSQSCGDGVMETGWTRLTDST